MRVRILRHSVGHINRFSLRHYVPGHTYELPPNLANYLVAQGYAMFEMRSDQLHQPPDGIERRRPPSG